MVSQAIPATRGQVLMSEGTICDARFSKCCGGAFEEFQYCWENTRHPYLRKQRDPGQITSHRSARPHRRSRSRALDTYFSRSVLQHYRQTHSVSGTEQLRSGNYRLLSLARRIHEQEELSKLILKRSGIDYGQILDFVPVARGTSGRLVRLKIIGTKRTMIIGKELEIRHTLSPSHLYSSAFIIDKVTRHKRNTGSLHPYRCRLGTRRRSLSDRCSRHGRARLYIRHHLAALLHRRQRSINFIKHTPLS